MLKHKMKLRFLIVPFMLSLGGCGFLLRSSCEDTVKSEIPSPDTKYVATVFERNCGATTDFSTVMNLRESSVKFRGDDLGVFIVKGQHKLDLSWDGNTKLRLRCSDCRPEDIFKQESNWKDIDISIMR